MPDSENPPTTENHKNSDSTEEIDHELEKIRLKRMQSLLKQKQLQSQQAESSGMDFNIEDKVRMVLQVIMTPEAYRYLLEIKDRDINVHQRIQQIMLPPQIMAQLDLLVQYASRGMLRQNMIDKIQIQQLERKILGIGPKITVKKRDGESTDLNSFLKNHK